MDIKNAVVNRGAVRAGALVAGTALMIVLTSSPALAAIRDDGDDPAPALSLAETLGLFVAAPIGLFLLIAGLVMVGDRSGKQQDRQKV